MRRELTMACFDKASPALKEILLKLYRAEKHVEIDHHLYEFGSVEYHIQSPAADLNHNYLSISTPLLSQGVLQSYGFSRYTLQMIKELCSDAIEIVDPPREGYQLTLKIDFSKIPREKDPEKVMTQISSVQAIILSSQLKEMLENVNSQVMYQGMYKPMKLVYHPREPFYVIKQEFVEKVSLPEAYEPQKITAVFPMRFKEPSDVIIATAFFQELVDVGSSEKWAKAPPCTWSPIPPPELQGEPLEDLTTNGGFVSFDISSRHVEGKKLDKTVWGLLNFYAYVKKHVKCTKGFTQRRMQKRLESLVEVRNWKSEKSKAAQLFTVLHKEKQEQDKDVKKVKENVGSKQVQKQVRFPRSAMLKQRCREFAKKIKQIRFRIKLRGFGHFRRRWLKFPKFSSPMKYTKLE